MDVLIAFGHIGGSILAVIVFGIVLLLIAHWETKRNGRRAAEDASVVLGVAVDDLDSEEMVPKIIQFMSSRYTSELLRNRLSDLCGALRTLWAWLGSLLQAAILIPVVWYTFTDDMETAIHAWWIVAVAIVFQLISVVFSHLCKLLTGRYPGEAKEAREWLAEFIRVRRREPKTSKLYGSA